MRSIWKGSISFGLVNVPVKVYSATEDHDIKFHQVHAKDNGRIRYKRVCEVDGDWYGESPIPVGQRGKICHHFWRARARASTQA